MIWTFLLGFIVIIFGLTLLYYIYMFFAFCGQLIFHLGSKERFANAIFFLLLLCFIALILYCSNFVGRLILK
jgi:hypothetical protein